MAYRIEDLKTGDIACVNNGQQLFYIHKIDKRTGKITTSGVDCANGFFDKSTLWCFDRVATQRERVRFFQIISSRGYDFNINTGVKL